MKKLNKGFTLIELLVVIAIIGILSSVVLASLSSARQKAQVAAFKSEVSGSVATFTLACDDGAPTAPSDSDVTDWDAAFDASSCGSSGSGTFSINAVPVNDDLDTCVASITETGVTFDDAGGEVAGCN